MPRIDKYEPLTGGTRAPLNVATVPGDLGVIFGVGLNANGRVVKGAGNTGIIGLMCNSSAKNVGAIVDIAQDCDIVDATGLVAGTVYWVDGVTGLLGAGAVGTGAVPAAGAGSTTGSQRAGFTVEADRLVVRVGRGSSTMALEQAAIVSLTDLSGGVANNSVEDVPAAYAEAALANNFADLTAKVNQILVALRDANVIAP